DCSGWIPCFRTRESGIEIFFADPTDLAPLGLPPFSFDLGYLGASVYHPTLRIRDCGLAGVMEVLAGDRGEVGCQGTRGTCAWNRAGIALRQRLDDAAEARDALRRTTQHCISAWAAVYRRVVLRLSGGLDSSIVLGCLAKTLHSPQIYCLNQFTEGCG